MKWFIRSLVALMVLGVAAVVILLIWLYQLNQDVKERLEANSFVPPTKYYSAPESIKTGYEMTAQQLAQKLTERGFRRRASNQRVLSLDFSVLSAEECRANLNSEFSDDLGQCLMFRSEDTLVPELQLVAFSIDGSVLATYAGESLRESPEALLSPELFAQFLENQPIFQRQLALGEAPTACLNAVLAIEDSRFLEHSGFSPTGILRAFVVNLKEGRAAQGGSTITQQLVKNLFLTHDKTLKRKIRELGMSVVLELQANKDQILQSYLNIIYLGQAGPFQIRGYKAASKHYFAKEIAKLNLGECALLAAIINSPGRYNPFKNPEAASSRRQLVLERMQELNLIDEEERLTAQDQPLPTRAPSYTAIATASYFVDAVNKELNAQGLEVLPGMSIYTSMDASAQMAAEESTQYLSKLQERAKNSENNKLEAALIGVDPLTGKIKALVGGRNFRTSPYNRAVEAKRQVGSVMKPFVYLAALESYDEEGQFYQPTSLINDQSFTHKYEGQNWKPVNYGASYFDEVPLFFALKMSLNAATARLGLDLGLEPVIDVARRLGVESDLKALPSLTLGAFELSLLEVARAYTAIARFGSLIPLSTVFKVEGQEGEVLYEPSQESRSAVDPNTVAVLIGMMKHTLQSGTAASAKAWGFTHPAAGKTGTTSDNKDAWFAGFTPEWVTITWVGYDNNKAHGLTGASGAVPIWSQFMREVSRKLPKKDFSWPEATEAKELNFEDLELQNPKLEERQNEFPVELIFRR